MKHGFEFFQKGILNGHSFKTLPKPILCKPWPVVVAQLVEHSITNLAGSFSAFGQNGPQFIK
jgi:hypothetical protein